MELEIEEIKKFSHSSPDVNSAIFFPQSEMVVSGGADSENLIFWNTKTMKREIVELQEHVDDEEGTFKLVRVNDDLFLWVRRTRISVASLSQERALSSVFGNGEFYPNEDQFPNIEIKELGTIHSLLIVNEKKLCLLGESFGKNDFLSLFSLRMDKLLDPSKTGSLMSSILKYPSNNTEFENLLKKLGIHWSEEDRNIFRELYDQDIFLRRSPSSPNDVVYFNIGRESREFYFRANHTTKEIEKVFRIKVEDIEDCPLVFDVISNEKNEDLLLICGEDNVFVYHTVSSSVIQVKRLEIFLPNDILVVKNSLLAIFCCDGKDGDLQLLDIANNYATLSQNSAKNVRFGDVNVNEVQVILCEGNTVDIMSCSDDSIVKVTRISGFSFEHKNKKLAKQDLRERLQFLRDGTSEYFFSEEIRKACVSELKLFGNCVPKSFLCL